MYTVVYMLLYTNVYMCLWNHVCIMCECSSVWVDWPECTYVKQKKRVVDPTRKVVAADTGTYRLGRNGRGGAEAGPPTPPPTPPPLKPGIRDRKRWEEDGERGRYLLSTYSKACFTGQKGKCSVCFGRGAMTTDWKGNPKLCKAATQWKYEGFSPSGH